MSATKRTRDRSILNCPHCGEEVSKSTFYNHRRDFYDPDTGEWSTTTKRARIAERALLTGIYIYIIMQRINVNII